MSTDNTIDSLEEKLNQLNSDISSMSGKCDLLLSQINKSNDKIVDLGRKKEIYKKSVEFLRLVEESTKISIKEGFESIVTYALRYIFQKDYNFNLTFNKRGNLQELDYAVSTPDFKEPYDPKDTSGGGILDIVSVALRIAILEKTKINGFLVLDESFRNIHNLTFIENAFKFLKEINKKLNKQIIFITGIEDTVALNYADKIIEIKKDK